MDLLQTLQQAKCEETGNLRTHIDSLVDLREKLAAMGKTITDDQFTAVLLRSLPTSYKDLASHIMTIAVVNGKPITPSTVIRVINNEYDTRTR